jgi:transposase
VRKRLERDLEKPPREFGIQRSSWDGPTLVVYLRKRFGVNVKVRQAQYWLRSLDYSLKRAGYVYLQARAKDARRFRRELKKTPPT